MNGMSLTELSRLKQTTTGVKQSTDMTDWAGV